MIKSSTIFSVHAIHVLLRNTLIFFIVILMALFFWLTSGIEIDTLNIGKFKIEKLYLKLDKKLTLKVKNIVIPKSKAKPSFDNIDKTFDTIKYLFTFFDEIDLNHVYFEDNKIHFVFVDDILYITSDDYEIAGNIHRMKQALVAEVSMLKLKKYDMTLVGELKYDLKKNQLSTTGEYDAFGITGHFMANKKEEVLDFNITSDTFTSLEPLADSLPIKEKIKSWINQKIKAQTYKLDRLEGKGYVGEDGFRLNFDTLKAILNVERAKVYFHKNLAPITADNFTLIYRNYALYARLNHPKYLERSLEKSKIAIVGLGDEKTLLKLDLHIQTLFDDEVKKILNAYHVHIPIKQKGKPIVGNIKLIIPLDKKDSDEKTVVNVAVHVKNSEVQYENITLPIKKASVQYDNTQSEHLRVNALFKKGIVKLGETKLHVLEGKGEYTKGKVILDAVHIKEDWYETVLSGTVNLTKKEGKFKTAIKSLEIGKKEKFIKIKNKTMPLNITYKKGVELALPSLGVVLKNKKETMDITVENIQKIKPYLKYFPIDIDGGSLEMIAKSGNYTFGGIFKREACFLYSKKGLCHTTIPFTATLKQENFNFFAFGKRLQYNAKKSRLHLNNIHIDLKKFLEERERGAKKRAKEKKLVILGKKSNIKYKTHTLVMDSYDIEISPKGEIKATGSLTGDIVNFSKKGKIFTLKALRIKDNMLHPLVGFDGLKDGRYSMTLSGNPNKVMRGKIIIEGGVMKNFKAYNNTLAFINALPALATFSSPGFSEKGFNIQEGVIEYRMQKENIIFDSIYIKGKSATVIGQGRLNMKKESIHVDLAIHTARELGKVVGNLPLLGYILLGKDKSVTVGLAIRGTFKNPKVNTSAAKDILTLPLKLIKRILESPAHIINQ